MWMERTLGNKIKGKSQLVETIERPVEKPKMEF